MRIKKCERAYRAVKRTFITLNINRGKKKHKAPKYIVLFSDTVKTIPHKLRTMRRLFHPKCYCVFALIYKQTNKPNPYYLCIPLPCSTIKQCLSQMCWDESDRNFYFSYKCSIFRSSLSSSACLSAEVSYFYAALIAARDSHIYFSLSSQ